MCLQRCTLRFWDNFMKEWFADGAVVRLQLWKDNQTAECKSFGAFFPSPCLLLLPSSNQVTFAQRSRRPSSRASSSRRPDPPQLQSEEGQEVIFMVPQDDEPRKDREGNSLPAEPDTPARPRRWIDRLAEGSSPQPSPGFRVWYGDSEWQPGLKTKLLIGVGVMWLLNLMWPRP